MKPTLTLTALPIALLGTFAHAQDTPMTEVSNGVYHFFAMGYSSMIVLGENGVLVTDPSFTPRAEMMKAELQKITDLPVTHVVLSHEHFDHVGGTEVFEGADVVLQENGVDVLKLSPLMPVPEVSTTFDNTLDIDLGGKTIELHHLAVGDGVATTVMRVAQDNVIYSVDMYMPEELSPSEFKEDTNFVGTAKILNTLVEWNPTYAINGHSGGNSVEALKENAKLMTALKTEVEARFQEAFATGDPAAPWMLLFSISDQIEMPEYADWENYETAFPAYVRRMALSVMHGG